MANYNALSSVFGTSFRLPGYGAGHHEVMKGRFSFATRNAVQNDVIAIMVIPAYSRIHSVDFVVVTAEGEGANISIGDYSDLTGTEIDLDGWVNGQSINGAVGTGFGTGVNSEAYGAAGGKFYAAAAYLCITCPTNITYDTGVVDVYVDITKYSVGGDD